jgi:glycosyltransferase involved in cell wall biosynthesis
LTATRTIKVLSVQPVAERGGSDQALLGLVRSLPRDAFDFHIALPGPSPLAAEFTAAGATLHVVPMARLSTSHGARAWARYVLGWPLAVARLTRLGRKLSVDLVHTNSLHSLYGWAAAILLRVPHVWHAREIVVQSSAARRLERFLCRHFATTVIAVSNAVAAQLDRRNVVVLGEPVDTDRFTPVRAGRFRAAVGIPDDVPVIGAVARIDPLKGIDVLLDAFPRVVAERPDARLVVVGSPVAGQEQYHHALSTRMGGEPAAALFVSRDDIPDVMADLDVLALASVEPESYGLVLVEALASGTLVVTTDHGGAPEVMATAEPGAGRLVPPGDAGALAVALLDLLPPSTSTATRAARHPLVTPSPPGFAAVLAQAAPHITGVRYRAR